MAGRVKIKSKVVKATLANKDVSEMFEGVLGSGDNSMAIYIIHPKYLRMRHHANRFIKLLNAMYEFKFMNYFPESKEHLGHYIAALQKQFISGFSAPDLSQWLSPAVIMKISPEAAAAAAAAADDTKLTASDYAQVPPEIITQFNEIFLTSKKCNIVNTIIVTCKNLIIHKQSLLNQNDLRDKFMTKSAQMSFAPLPDLVQLNFKQIYIDDRLTPEDKDFILTILHKMLTISHDQYEAVASPDVDVDEFVQIIMSSISEVKKHIPRCDQAFQKIIDSVSMLKGNFGDYYKEFTASGNPTIIMENFVLDVAKSTNSTPKVTAQFRTIIAHYRKLASQQASHPKLQSLFQQVDANFQELEKRSKKADAAAAEDDSDSDVDELPEEAPVCVDEPEYVPEQ